MIIMANTDYELIKENYGQILLVPMSNLTLEKTIINASDIEYERRRTRWVTFESANGVIKQPSLCDYYANLKFQVLISEDVGPNYKYTGEPTQPLADEGYYELMRSFLFKYDGESVRVISEMFETFDGVIEEITQKNEAGMNDAIFDITIEGLR